MKHGPISHAAITKQDAFTILQAPLLTPRLIKIGSPEETVLAMRAEDLFSFRRTGVSALIRLFGYQAKEGIWVVVAAFRLSGFPAGPLEGAAYLNPREASAMPLLLLLAKQERFPFIVFSPRLKISRSLQAPWSVHQRQEVRVLLSHLQQPSGSQPSGMLCKDPEFERARQEFERAAGGNVLLLSSRNERGPISPSQGVVLE